MSSPVGPEQRRVLIGAAVVLALFVVAGTALLLLSVLHTGSGGSARPAATAGASRTPSSAVSAASPSPSATPTPPPTAEQLKDFVVQYLDTATRDQAASWQALTPRFQAASGGFGSYRAFWGDIERAEPSEFATVPADSSVSYRVRYTRRDGSVSNDVTRLHLVQTDAGLRIDAEG